MGEVGPTCRTKYLSPFLCIASCTKPDVTRAQTQCTEREHVKQVLKTRFYFCNYFTRYNGTDAHGSQEFNPNFSFTIDSSMWFRYQMLVCA